MKSVKCKMKSVRSGVEMGVKALSLLLALLSMAAFAEPKDSDLLLGEVDLPRSFPERLLDY